MFSFFSFEVIRGYEAGLDWKSKQSSTIFYENVGEVVAVDIKSKIAGSKSRWNRDFMVLNA